MATRGSYVHISLDGRIFRGIPKMLVLNFYAIFSENLWFQTKRFTGLLELIQLYKQNPLEKFFVFTIYQNYTSIGFNISCTSVKHTSMKLSHL